MIGYLKGKVLEKQNDSIILLVGGIGYHVFIGPTLNASCQLSSELSLYTHTHVRDDALELYGVKSAEELYYFKLFITVSGVGNKTGLMIVDRGVLRVINAITNADVDFFTSIPRLGKKNAQKIIIELKNKVGSTAELNLMSTDSKEISDALVAMGYSKQEIVEAIKNIPEQTITIEEKIRYALRALSKV